MEHKTSASSRSVCNEIIGRNKLLNGTFASSAQGVRLNVLEAQIFKNVNFSLNIMMGDETINAGVTHAYAVLPFNKQLGS
jgi:hypothetical protein